MKSFIEIRESFVNLIGASSKDERRKYGDEVFTMLQNSYASVGGIKGTGFANVEDMINKIPFWKLYFHKGKLQTVIMYKDSSGRKLVAVGSDGTPRSKKIFISIFKHSWDVAWGETSKAMLGFIMKNIPFSVFKGFLIPRERVGELLGKEVSIPDVASLSTPDKKIFNKYETVLGDYFYTRKIGTGTFLKVGIGTASKKIA